MGFGGVLLLDGIEQSDPGPSITASDQGASACGVNTELAHA
jgi:hypothetical protein